VAVLCCAVLCCKCSVLWLCCAVTFLIDLPSLTLNSPQICTAHATCSPVNTATSGRRNPFRFQFICHAKANLATFEVPTAVLSMSEIFWDVTVPALLGPENEGVPNLPNFEHYCTSVPVTRRHLFMISFLLVLMSNDVS